VRRSNLNNALIAPLRHFEHCNLDLLETKVCPQFKHMYFCLASKNSWVSGNDTVMVNNSQFNLPKIVFNLFQYADISHYQVDAFKSHAN
jgi:hypothetical protein